MSLAALHRMVADLPYSLRDPVAGYAAAVSDSAVEIFREADLRFDLDLRDELVFIAGVRRLWGIVSGRFWLLDRSLELVQADAEGIIAGSDRLVRKRGTMAQLERLASALETEFRREGLWEIVQLRSLTEVVRALRERR